MKLLYGSCLKCHHLLAPRWSLQLIVQQLRCLDNGLLGSVGDLTELAHQVVSEGEAGDGLANEVDVNLKEYVTAALRGTYRLWRKLG